MLSEVLFGNEVLSPDMQTIRQLVEKYCSTERHPSLGQLQIYGPLQQGRIGKPEQLDAAGCYVIYDASGCCRYVGVSVSRIGTRIGTHLSPRTQNHPFWRNRPAAYIDLIAVEKPWRALSLEGYLLEETAVMTGAPPPEQ